MKRALPGFIVVAVAATLFTASCGDDAAEPDARPITLFDATPPDAAQTDAFVCTLTECGTECVDLSNDPKHCGECFEACNPAASCAAPVCTCPENFIPASLSFVLEQVGSLSPPDVVGFGAFSGSDDLAHLVLVTTNPDTVEIGVDIDITKITDSTQIGFGYDATMTSVRSGFIATTGTLHLTRSCAGGVAGTLTDGGLVEVDFTSFAPIEGGCTLSGVTTSFDIGDACDGDAPDAGTADAGPPDAPPAT